MMNFASVLDDDPLWTHPTFCSCVRWRRMAYFTGPHPQTLVECVPSTKCNAEAPKYQPITAIDHVMEKIQKSQKALAAV